MRVLILALLLCLYTTASHALTTNPDGSVVLTEDEWNTQQVLNARRAAIITQMGLAYEALKVQVSNMVNCPVAPVASGPFNGQLSWAPPTERVDGSPVAFSEIGGFFLYYGTSQNNLNVKIRIPDRNAIAYTVDGLLPNTDYYFAISAYDVDGVESVKSNVVMKHTP